MSANWTTQLVELEPITDDVQNANDYSTGIDLYMHGVPLKFCNNAWQRRGWKDARIGEQVAIVVDAVFANGGNGEDADYAIESDHEWIRWGGA